MKFFWTCECEKNAGRGKNTKGNVVKRSARRKGCACYWFYNYSFGDDGSEFRRVREHQPASLSLGPVMWDWWSPFIPRASATCVYLLHTLGSKLNFKINYNFQIELTRRLSAVVKVCAKKLHRWIYAMIKFQSLRVTSTCWFDRFGKRGEYNPLNALVLVVFVPRSMNLIINGYELHPFPLYIINANQKHLYSSVTCIIKYKYGEKNVFCRLNTLHITFPASVVVQVAWERLPLTCLLCFESDELSSCLKLLPKQTGTLCTNWDMESKITGCQVADILILNKQFTKAKK